MTKTSSILKPTAAASGEYDLTIHGDIGSSWWGDSVSAADVASDLRDMPTGTKKINVGINTFGGSVADGLAIYNALRAAAAKGIRIVVTVDGVAFSAGSLIAMSGDEIRMPATSLMMIHGPSSGTYGNAGEMREAADVLDKWGESMIGAYTRKTGKSDDEIRSMLTDGDDHWYTGQEAVDAGFADTLIDDLSEPAMASLTRAPVGVRHLAMAAFRAAASNPQEPKMAKSVKTDPEPVNEATAEAEAEAEAQANARLQEIVAAQVAEATAKVEAEASAKIAAAQAEVASANAKLAVEVEAKELAAAVAEAEAAYANLPMAAKEFGPAVRAARKASPEAMKIIEKVLAQSNAVIGGAGKSPLEPVGSTATEELTTDEKVEALAKAKIEANSKLTPEQARAAVYSENPDIVAALRGEKD